ncbi:plasmid recombination protein [Streptobacillus moniliformis]|uniref:plasmid recombination protein n=1 Tax=Streptobacillus moniliformis TaxID=34105 RepID=UPI0007E3BB90|nr:plasmid recombination protein [Streptobacillus moniliformis]
MALSYSFHIGSKNHSIKNLKKLVSVQKHNLRKFESNKFDKSKNEILIGTENLVNDVKDFYKNFFEDSLKKYNDKQKKESRKIENYFENISNSLQKEIAVESIIQVGDMKFWETKSLEERKKMTPIFQDQINKLQKELPNYKIISAVIHYDESSPHIQIVGVPIKENCKTGLEKQVSKSSVFKKEKLEYLQDKLRENLLEQMQSIYGKDIDLKAKEKGRNKDLFVNDYIEMKKNLEENLEREYKPKIAKLEKKVKEQEEFLVSNEISTNHLVVIDKLREKKKRSKFSNQEYYDANDVENGLNLLSKANYEVKAYQNSLKLKESENKALNEEKDYLNLENKNLSKEFSKNRFIMNYLEKTFPKFKDVIKTINSIVKEYSPWNKEQYEKEINKFLNIENQENEKKKSL